MKQLIRTKQDLKDWLKADYEVYGFKHPFLSKFTYGENAALFSLIKTLRMVEFYTNKKQYPWDKLIRLYYLLSLRRKNLKFQIYIAPNTVGKGFHLVHCGFRMIPKIKRIGSNCTVLPMVLIGKKDPTVDNSETEIGDYCYIGAGSVIMTPIHIGNNVTIGAGSVVMKDIPDHCVVAGNPARIIKQKRNTCQ